MGMEAANTPVMTQILVLCVVVIRSMPCTQTVEHALVSSAQKHASFYIPNRVSVCVCVCISQESRTIVEKSVQ